MLKHLVLVAALAAAPSPQATAPPAPCIAVMSASVTGVDGSAADAGSAVRDLVVSFLKGPSMAPVPLEARVRQLAIEEAKQKGCAYIVTASVSLKRGGSGSGFGQALGRAAGTAAWSVPGGAGFGGAVVRSATVSAAEAVQQMTSSTRAKDEMRLEWTLAPLSAETAAMTRNDKLKASSDGEDLLTPLVQRAAEAIVRTVLKQVP